MKIFEYRDRLVSAALSVAKDNLGLNVGSATEDAESEYHDSQLDQAAAELVAAFFREGKALNIEGMLPYEVMEQGRAQVVIYLCAKADQCEKEEPARADALRTAVKAVEGKLDA